PARARAPPTRRAILIARGVARDVETAIAFVRERRPVSAPTRVDAAVLETAAPALPPLQRPGEVGAPGARAPRPAGAGRGGGAGRPLAGELTRSGSHGRARATSCARAAAAPRR